LKSEHGISNEDNDKVKNMGRTCEESPPGQLLQGIREFNRGEWHDCHETVEELWIGERGEVRDFYQGIIQVAIALHHWRNGNYGGAVSLLKGGAGYLRRVSDRCQWVDVVGLIADADAVRSALEELGKEGMERLDPALIPQILTIAEGCKPSEAASRESTE
jgi:predicted metal-dependent hydrolase